jgi:hypothetical protein
MFFFETSVDSQWITSHYIPEYRTPFSRLCFHHHFGIQTPVGNSNARTYDFSSVATQGVTQITFVEMWAGIMEDHRRVLMNRVIDLIVPSRGWEFLTS